MARTKGEGSFMFQGNRVTKVKADPDKSGNSIVRFMSGHEASVPSAKIVEVKTSTVNKPE